MPLSSTDTASAPRRLATLVALAGLLALGAGEGRAQEPAAAIDTSIDTTAARTAAPFADLSDGALAVGDSIVARARAQLGRRYVLGGTDPKRGFDCSGLVRYAVAAFGLEVPRTAARQARVGEAVPVDTTRLRPGDLLTFGSSRRISHVGIYVGNGRFIHASSKAGRVIESRIDRPIVRHVKPIRGARRLVVATADTIGHAGEAVAR